MLKFILPLSLFCASVQAEYPSYPIKVAHDNQYELIGMYSQTFPEELHLLVIHDRQNDLYGCYVVSYFDKCLYELNFLRIMTESELVPYEQVKDLKELRYISEEDYGFSDSASL